MYIYGNEHNIWYVLTFKDDIGSGEHPITIFSRTFQGYENKYNFVQETSVRDCDRTQEVKKIVVEYKDMVYVANYSVMEYIMEGQITKKIAN